MGIVVLITIVAMLLALDLAAVLLGCRFYGRTGQPRMGTPSQLAALERM